MGESGLDDQRQLSLQLAPAEMAAVPQIFPSSGNKLYDSCMGVLDQKDGELVSAFKIGEKDSTCEVGSKRKCPYVSSIDQEDGRLVPDYKRVKIDEVDDYIKRCFGEGNYGELLSHLNEGKGVWADHLRTVLRAKLAKRRRGESDNAKDLCDVSSLADEGLTFTEIRKLRRYFNNHLRHIRGAEEWSREVKAKGVYGAFLRALFRAPKRASFYDVLTEMKKELISLKYLALTVTEVSCSEVIQQSSG